MSEQRCQLHTNAIFANVDAGYKMAFYLTLALDKSFSLAIFLVVSYGEFGDIYECRNKS